MSEQRTVKVRIAVAVDPSGAWNACGWGEPDEPPDKNDESAMESAVDTVTSGESRFFLTAELPIPAPVEIEATVETVEPATESSE